MALTPGDACVQACPNCAALVDIIDQEPLSKFHCPMCGTAMRANRQYNHFAIIEALGQGGMGTVYKALDRNLNRPVALKLLRRELSADDNYILKLEDEARITASINHPYVVKVFSFGSDHGQYYIAMELVDKGTLDDLMQLQNRIAELQVLQVGLQVASGLQAALERGLIHRDVKPGNILFADAHTAKITDFGLALLAEHEADSRGEIWGTPYYIAPEKLNNEPEDFRSDIYSLGGTLFHAVAGRPPFEAESASLVALKHLKSRAVSLQAFAPDVSSETAYVINRMLHKDPNQRYASYGELTDHFKYAIDTLTANTAKPRVVRERVVVESQRQNNVAGVLTLVLLTLLIVGGGLAWYYRDRFLGGDNANATPATAANALTSDAKASADAAYEDARHQIVTGQYADAQEAFKTLLQRPDLTQPLLDWARLHYGMTALLNQQLSDSRAIFGNLQHAGLFSTAPGEHALANFFPETGRYLADDKNVPAGAVKIWSKDTFENTSLFLFGLKDWEQGDFEDADGLFEAYLSGKPPTPYQWINEYAPIARKCVHDYGLYAPLKARQAAGTDSPALLQADFAKARGQLQTSGRIVEAFFSAENDIGKPPAAAAIDTPGPMAAPAAVATQPLPTPALTPAPVVPPAVTKSVHDAETVRWQTVRETYERMVALNRFDEAQAVLDHVQFTDPDYHRAHDLLRARASRLIAFKRTLINDINGHGGYPKPIISRRGNAYPRGLQLAANDMLQAGTPYGTIGVPWTDFSPQAILAVAAYYTDAATNPAQAADRRWLAANYALESGQTNEARALAARAVQAKPEYQKEMEQFTGGAGAANPMATP